MCVCVCACVCVYVCVYVYVCSAVWRVVICMHYIEWDYIYIGYDHPLTLLVGMFVPNARTLSHPHHGLLENIHYEKCS